MMNTAHPGVRMSLWYTRKELLLAYGLQWVAMRTGAYGVEEMTDDEQIDNFSTVAKGLRWATRLLDQKGYRFKAVEINGKGEVQPKTTNPIEPANALILHKLANNSQPSPIIFCNELLNLLESRPDISLDKDPIYSVLEEAENDRDAALAEWGHDPEYHRMAQEAFDNLMGSIGVVRRSELAKKGN